jgi:hypothetical protein
MVMPGSFEQGEYEKSNPALTFRRLIARNAGDARPSPSFATS